ncbi:MAG: DNA-directed RNA polymerase subunit H [DPANN group archaeon]|nr:DNA-directed RNA polymerase subunit H [DPANN group archaeon]
MAHNLIPKHEILIDAQVKTLLEKYHIEKSNLPHIFDTDVIAKQLGAKPGDVICIERASKTAGISLYYRLVVSEEGEDYD